MIKWVKMTYNSRTLKADNVPRALRIPYVINGYRLPYQPWTYYMKSLFHAHNETVNIWTHLIGCILLAYQVYSHYQFYSGEGSDIKWTVLGFGTCSFITLFNSTIAHLLHSKSCHANCIIFMYDYAGVVNWAFGIAILAVYGVSSKTMYDWMGPHFLNIQVVWTYLNFINICISKLWYGHDLSNGTRKLMIVVGCALQGIWNFVPWLPRYIDCYGSPECELSSLNHLAVVCVAFVGLVLSFVLHQPERSWPGRCDLIGQSHQIFHVMVMITMWLQLRALRIDYMAKHNTHCKPDLHQLIICILVVNVSCLVTLFLLTGKVKRTIDNNNKRK